MGFFSKINKKLITAGAIIALISGLTAYLVKQNKNQIKQIDPKEQTMIREVSTIKDSILIKGNEIRNIINLVDSLQKNKKYDEALKKLDLAERMHDEILKLSLKGTHKREFTLHNSDILEKIIKIKQTINLYRMILKDKKKEEDRNRKYI